MLLHGAHAPVVQQEHRDLGAVRQERRGAPLRGQRVERADRHEGVGGGGHHWSSCEMWAAPARACSFAASGVGKVVSGASSGRAGRTCSRSST